MYNIRQTLVCICLAVTTLTISAHARQYTVKRICDFDKAIKAGKYKGVDYYTTKKKAPKEACHASKKAKIIVIQFPEESKRSDEIRKQVKDDGCRQGKWADLYAIGAAIPTMQKAGPVVALGSKWKLETGGIGVPMLNANNKGERFANVTRDMGGWDRRWSFVIVCEKPKKVKKAKKKNPKKKPNVVRKTWTVLASVDVSRR